MGFVWLAFIGVVAGCATTSPKIGWQATLSTLAHQVGGVAVIVDDCTIRIDKWNYDGGGGAPAVYWWGGNPGFNPGIQLSDTKVPAVRASGSTTLTITLRQGVTLDQFTAISVWCDAVNIDFGSGTFAQPPQPTAAPTSAPTAAPTMAPTAAPTMAPTAAPVQPTAAPTSAPVQPTAAPTSAPVQPQPTTAPATPTPAPVSTSGCTSTHAKVGWAATLTTKAHDAGGVAVIVDDCTIRVDKWTYDGGGGAPAAYWWGGNPTFNPGVKLSDTKIPQVVADGSGSVTVTLRSGVTLDQFTAFSAWCEAFKADFASGTFAPTGPTAAPTTAPSAPPANTADGYSVPHYVTVFVVLATAIAMAL